LIKIFWEGHDPTQKDRQGNDRGPQYRSALFVNNQAEYDLAQQTGQNFQKQLKNSGVKGPIATEIKILTEFFYAEDYHQQYLYKNPGGYCSLKGTGVTCA
jgi:peptide-methionine (S)-S-oxide reductase